MAMSVFDDRARRRPNERTHRSLRLEPLESRVLLSGDAPIAPIVNGDAVSGWSPVGGLIRGDSNLPADCTATLISNEHILTAAHCVDSDANGVLDFGEYYWRTTRGSDLRSNSVLYRVKEVYIHPGYQIIRRNGDFVEARNDVAVLRLETLVRGVVPFDISRAAPQFGQTLTILGFGRTAEIGDPLAPNGLIRHRGYTYLNRVEPFTLGWDLTQAWESNIAPGDSGGPSFVYNSNGAPLVAGVHSYGSTAASSPGAIGVDMRVDAYASWIDSITGIDPDGPEVLTITTSDITTPNSFTPNIRIAYGTENQVTLDTLSTPHLAIVGPE